MVRILMLVFLLVAGCSENCPTQVDNQPPVPPFNPFPEDGCRCEASQFTLSWDCYDPDGDSLTYDFYFVFEEAGEENWVVQKTLTEAKLRLNFGWERCSGRCRWRVSVSDGRHFVLGSWWTFWKVY